MKTIARPLVLSFLCCLSAAPCFAGAGTSAEQFLTDGAGARAAGMGEAYSALADEASALYWNPAALAALPRRSATFMQAALAESASYSYGAYGQRIGDLWGIGAGAQRRTAGTLAGKDINGFDTGGFTPADTALSVGGARKCGPVYAGAAAKWIQSKVVDSASTGAADLGVLWPGLAGGRLSAAFTATNLLGKINYGRESEKLPSDVRLGAGYRPTARWTIGLDLVRPSDGGAYANAGFEAGLYKNERMSLVGRAGYSTRANDAGGASGFSAGLGFGFQSMTLDYAFVPMGDLGAAHRVSLSYGF